MTLAEQKDAAYRERDMCVAALARAAGRLGCLVWIGRHQGDPWDDDWRNIVFLELPTGQVSWHIHDSELPMFEWVIRFDQVNASWDGHSTEEKYRRLDRWLNAG